MTSDNKALEELLRQSAAEGNEEMINSLLCQNINVNSHNSMNGWTALHWACKRGHSNIVALLLKAGADPTKVTTNGESCLQITSEPKVRVLFGVKADDPIIVPASDKLPITPNYLAHPVFPFNCSTAPLYSKAMTLTSHDFSENDQQELVLKVRIANSNENDFIEIDLPRTSTSLTYENLVSLMCRELEADMSRVQKIRKLPNTIIRRDKDIQRLQDFQELELILLNPNSNINDDNVVKYKASVAPKHVDIVY